MNYDNHQNLIKDLKSVQHVIIFGAKRVSQNVGTFLINEVGLTNILGFAVSNKTNNVDTLIGLPVYCIDELSDFTDNSIVLITTMGTYLTDIFENLTKHNFKNIVPFTFESRIWNNLREDYFMNKIPQYVRLCDLPVTYTNENYADKFRIFQFVNVQDCKVKSNISFPCKLNTIQTGCALTNSRIADIADNTGDNISKKNPKLCELTAIYWLWKHKEYRNSDYIGFCHYRRRINVDSKMFNAILCNNIAAVITTPVINYDNVYDIYSQDHISDDWFIMMETLNQMYPDYYDTATEYFKGNNYSGYHLMIVTQTVFEQYCEWLFPILLELDRRIPWRDDVYQNRAVGFLSERLSSLFFEHNRGKLNIAYSDIKFIV